MAVPTSGTLSQLALAQEALYATYGSGTVTGPISLYDMVNGGNTNGSGNSYPAINTGCLPNPANRTYSSFTAGIFGSGNCVDIFYSGSLSSLTNGSQLYSSNGGATNLTAGNYGVCDCSITVFGCSGCCGAFTINSSNVVTANSNGVCCP